MLFREENRYLDIARKILDEGYYDPPSESRTGIGATKLHVEHMEFTLLDGKVPILSTRKVPYKNPIIELCWFASGSTDIKFLKDRNCSVWDQWVLRGTEIYDQEIDVGLRELEKRGLIKFGEDMQAKARRADFMLKYGDGLVAQLLGDLTGVEPPARKLLGGSIGPGAYGAQWRKWEDTRAIPYNDETELNKLTALGYRDLTDEILPGAVLTDNPALRIMRKEYDQLQEVIDRIKNKPCDRRIIVSAWNPGRLDQAALPPCFTPGALVATPEGYKEIIDVNIGDIVYSATGKKRTVLEKWITPYKGEMFSFRVDYIGQPIECTPNHPFLVKGRGYVEAKDIKPDDVLAIPRVKIIKNHVHTYNYIESNTGVEKTLEHELTLDDYFTLGYYLGNGWCNEKKFRVSIAIPHKKLDFILPKLRNTLKVSIKPGPNKSCATYETKSKKFFELFKAFGQGAFNKKIPDFILNSSVKFKYEFIRGYLEADGCVGVNGEKKFTTVSPSLAYGLQRLLLETGRVASVQYQKRPPKTTIEGREVNQHDTYSVTITKHSGWHGQKKSTSFDTEYAWVGIKRIEKFDYDGNVYNIGLDEEHTYIVNNIANHNCHSFFQFLPFEKNGVKYLDLSLTCRSQDFLLGTVFNVMQYGVLCHLVAKLTGRVAHKLYWTGNNIHIYDNQKEIFDEYHRERSPLKNNIKLEIADSVQSIADFLPENIQVTGYDNFMEPIKYPIAV